MTGFDDWFMLRFIVGASAFGAVAFLVMLGEYLVRLYNVGLFESVVWFVKFVGQGIGFVTALVIVGIIVLDGGQAVKAVVVETFDEDPKETDNPNRHIPDDNKND